VFHSVCYQLVQCQAKILRYFPAAAIKLAILGNASVLKSFYYRIPYGGATSSPKTSLGSYWKPP
jgi:hypothetical protein